MLCSELTIVADNDVSRIFTGGTVLQRPALNIVNGIVFAGFGGHCDQYNFTGWVVGMQTNTGKLMTAFATVGGPGSPAPGGEEYKGGGGGAAIWMGGSAIASDQAGRIFFATGNGQKGAQNQGQPASGRLKLNTMNEAVVNMAVNPTTGVVTQSDYFEPYTYSALDNADRDLGSGGVALLDPNTFNGNGVARIAVTVGKNGVCYVLNADNLGGYKLGTGGTDAILQTITMPGSGPVFGNPGSYPLEGGYMYITPNGYPTLVYSFGKTSTGSPAFTLVAQSADVSAGRVGTGSATITTYKGQPGTAILWVVDPDAGLRAYNAVPSNGQLTKLTLPPTPAVAKFQRPAFGDGRYYLSTSNGKILAYGSPVALPMTCNTPIDFGQVAIGDTKTLIVTCKTNIAITKLNGFATNKPVFQVSNSSLPTGPLALGATFSFPVTFNLTALILTGSTSSPSVTPGVQTSSVWISTTNGKAGFAPQQPISLTGTAISAAPFITVNPLQVDFAGVVVGSANSESGSDATFILSNVGLSDMTVLGMVWTSDAVNSPNAVFHNLTTVNGKMFLDGPGYFTSTTLPSIGQVIPAGSTMTVNANFNTNITGTYSSIVKFYTNGNTAYTLFTGSAATNPVALLEYSTNEGGWVTIPHCTDLVTGCIPQVNFAPSGGLTAQTIQLRLTNNGGSVLTVTKSKPLEGAELGATNPSTDFYEGQTILPGKSAIASILFSPGAAILNADDVTYSGAWTLNTDDQTFGVHVITFNGVVTSKKTGPLTSSGQSLYKYLGCYQDYVNNVRLEPKQINNASLTNGWCQSQALAAGVVFAGTEYMTECWVGNVIPSPTLKGLDSQCAYTCGGSSNEACGGVNGFISLYYDSSRYFPQNGTILGTSGLGPQRPKTIGAYNYAGCYSDSQTARSLVGKQTAGATISLDTCASFCQGFNYFGVEYANECYCANTLAASSVLKPDADCSMNCAGNSSQFCGAGSRLSLYLKNSTVLPSSSSSPSGSTAKPSSTSVTVGPTVTPVSGGYTSLGCYSDNDVTQRTLVGAAFPDPGQTIEMCALKCKNFGFFGVEYGVECYCGPAIVDSSVLTTDGRCNMPCGGNSAQTCGGSYGMNIYSYNPISSSSTVSTSSLSSRVSTVTPSIASTKSTSVSTSAPTGTSNPFTSMGCWTDNDVTERTLIGGAYTDQALTLSMCSAFCQGFAYFGVEYSVECYCGNNFGSTSALATDGRCNMPCKGDTTQTCGGSYGMNIYKVPTLSSSSSSSSVVAVSTSTALASRTSTSSTKSSTPTPSIPAVINEFTYQHCRSDNTTKRTMVGKYIAKPDMTLENCAGNCTGYRYFGVEYASECYCSNQLSFGSFIATDGRCKMPCLGNKMEICGGSGGLTLYSNETLPGSSSSSSSVLLSTTLFSATASVSLTLSSSVSSVTSKSSTSATSSASARPTATGPTPAYINDFNYLYCATDVNDDRTLFGKYLASGSMTLDLCASTCVDYRFFGVEYGSECFCGDTLAAISTNATDGRCNYPCPGNAAETCGGLSGLTLYTKDSVSLVSGTSSVVSFSSSLSTLAASSSSTALPSISPSSGLSSLSSSLQPSSSSSSTVVPLTTSRSSSSVPATSLPSSSVLSTISSTSSSSLLMTSTSSSSSSQSISSSTQSTSSSSRSSSVPTSSSSSSTRPSSTLVSTTGSSTPSATASPDTWNYLGCMNDTTTARAISGATLTNTTAMTVGMCKDFCESKNYPLAGLENLGICFCGLAVKNGGSLGQIGCTSACPGDKSQFCGGSKRLNVYKNTAYIPPTIPRSSGPYNYTACYTELTNARAMTGYTFTNTTGMTVDVCTSTCSTKGYLLAGLQFGTQCYCSNTISAAAPVVDDSQCQVLACPGEKLQYCSAASRLQVYSS
ncbi:hypothetical protein ONS95_013153 [Cadophora gregata]|uniref:uncharacterized protein n=1 Tax=Cadophora gregata TaxID=51156 RepID=UPI0026DD1468|nr:uncharacterized protein ONS95_013153 [Cadophora gregata]KAK0100032.1 hypothetical protein ONS96_007971 [Cadophora gregata f. sp. sojae]KAK0116121.1 hypothetical protein ONS95_013153 [Cadophora gregata]